MKRLLMIVFTVLLLGSAGLATPLTGIKTVGVSVAHPTPDYMSLAAAIADLNAQGVGAGGVTFNLEAGYTETFTYYEDGLITATGTASNPIVFQRMGETGANPKITAPQGVGDYDYVFCTAGADYITFDAIDLTENPLNTDYFTQMEFGYTLLLASVTNGSQHITIKNCNITLNKENPGSYNTGAFGIHSHNWLYTLPGSNKIITDVSGANSFNSFYSNHISNVYNGIGLFGYASSGSQSYAFYDQNNDIGSLGGNTITNFGGGSQDISGIYTYYQNNLIVANNSVTGPVTSTGSGNNACDGIRIGGSTNNANLDLYNNYVSIQLMGANFTGFNGIFDEMSSTFNTTNIINIHHNTVTGCTYANAKTGNCNYMQIWQVGPNNNYHHNIITDNVYGSDTTIATGTVNYLTISGNPTGGTYGTSYVNNNIVSGNVRKQSTPGGGSTNYMYLNPQSINVHIVDNVVDNNIAATKGAVYGIETHTNQALNRYVHGNTVTNIKDAKGVSNYAMSVQDGTNSWVYNNKIQDFTANEANSTLWGFYFGSTAPSGKLYFYNNIIGGLKTPHANSTAAIKAVYILGFQTDFVGCYNNTIFMDASSTGADFGTTAMYFTEYPMVIDLRNNIVDNISAHNGSGVTIAIQTTIGNSGFPNLSSTSNNNCYYAGAPSISNLIYYDGIKGEPTLLLYKNRVYPKELRSVTENPPFISIEAPFDLHLRPNIATQCESGGNTVSTPIAVTTDYDGDARYPNSGYPNNVDFPATRPDIGADEFAGIPLDQLSPVIQYNPLLNTSSSADRVLTATISDEHGVPTSGIGLPRVCWKKNYNGTWVYVTGNSIGSDKYTFTFGGGGALHDTIYYFVLAQDINTVPNVGSLPFGGASGYTANPPAVSTPVDNAAKFVIVTSICGTFNVGTGQAYPTLTAAITDINNREIVCPVTLVLTDATYGGAETFPVTINPNNGSSAVNTLTIKPLTGINPVISSSSVSNGILKINGFDYLVVDGSYAGGTDMHLTWSNTSKSNGAYTIGLFNYGGYEPSDNITIKNSKIKAVSSVLLATRAITLDGNGVGYQNCIIDHDSITAATIGIYFAGTANGISHNGQITNNVIGSLSYGKDIANKGIHLQYVDNTLIEGNDIMGMEMGTDSIELCGIYVSTGSTSTKIRKNKIHDWNFITEKGIGAWGISYNSDASTVTEISNNSIYNIKCPGAAPGLSPNNGYGIYISTGGNLKILHNSIYMTGNVLSLDGMYDASSACIGIHPATGFTSNLEIRNNILKNSQRGIGGACSRDGVAYAVMTNTTSVAFTIINNNDYFADGCSGMIGGYSSNTKFSTLEEWKTFTGQDANSLNLDPLFTSASNLLPTATNMNHKGAYIASVPTDINGTSRSNPPDMGAYEFATDPLVTTTAATDITASTSVLNGLANANDLLCNLYFDYGLTTAYGTSIAATPVLITGNVTTAMLATISGLQPLTTYHFRARAVSADGVAQYGNDLTFTTLFGIPENLTVNTTISNDTCFNASQTITVAGTPNTFIVTSTGSVTMIAGLNIKYLPGTQVQPGGYLHGYITSTNNYCGTTSTAPVVAMKSVESEETAGPAPSLFRIYPNPTSGNFTLELAVDAELHSSTVEIYSMSGVKLVTREITGMRKIDFSVSNMLPGIYFIHVLSGNNSGTSKLIKL